MKYTIGKTNTRRTFKHINDARIHAIWDLGEQNAMKRFTLKGMPIYADGLKIGVVFTSTKGWKNYWVSNGYIYHLGKMEGNIWGGHVPEYNIGNPQYEMDMKLLKMYNEY